MHKCCMRRTPLCVICGGYQTQCNVYLCTSNTVLHGVELALDAQVQKCIGYVPQFDALLGLLNSRELLTMYAQLTSVSLLFL